jgi:hypothetical protein
MIVLKKSSSFINHSDAVPRLRTTDVPRNPVQSTEEKEEGLRDTHSGAVGITFTSLSHIGNSGL